MAGFAKGLLSGAALGGVALAGMAVALPGLAPQWGDQPVAAQQSEPAPSEPTPAEPADTRPLLVVPDPDIAQPARVEATETVPESPTAAPAEVGLQPVPAGSEFARDREDTPPHAPARQVAPRLVATPMDSPVVVAPLAEAAPGEGLDTPAARPVQGPDLPRALPLPDVAQALPARPDGEAPIPVPPPGEALAPALILPLPEAVGPRRAAEPSNDVRIPVGLTPPPQILIRP